MKLLAFNPITRKAVVKGLLLAARNAATGNADGRLSEAFGGQRHERRRDLYITVGRVRIDQFIHPMGCEHTLALLSHQVFIVDVRG
jgi:hypothetical protein